MEGKESAARPCRRKPSMCAGASLAVLVLHVGGCATVESGSGETKHGWPRALAALGNALAVFLHDAVLGPSRDHRVSAGLGRGQGFVSVHLSYD